VSGFNSVNQGFLGGGAGGGSGSGTGFYKSQFKIGQPGSPMTAGETVLVISLENAKEDSESVYLDGSLLPEDEDDRISYQIVYAPTQVTITFNQAVLDTQLYQIKMAVTT